MNSELNTLLNALSAASDSNIYSVFVPSIKENVSFKSLNTEQFNRILSTVVVEVSDTQNSFNPVFNSILRENILNSAVEIEQLTIFDRAKIALETRKSCVTDNYDVYFTDEEIETYNLSNSVITISLNEFLQQKQDLVIQESKITTVGSVSVTVSLPTVAVDRDFDIKLNYSETDSDADIIKRFFIKEVTKYVQEVKIDSVVVNMLKESVEDRVKIINTLPANLINEAINTIESIKSVLNALLTVNVEVPTADGKTVVLSKELPLDGTLFNF